MPAHRQPPTRARDARRPATVLALALVFALVLGGCGGKEEPGAPKGDDKPSASEGPSKDGEPAADPGAGAPKVGACYAMTGAQSVASVGAGRAVGCKSQHTSVVAYVGFVPKPVTPRTPVVERRVLGKKLCEPAYRRMAGGTLADRAMSILTWTLFTPGQADLVRGARWVRCDVVARSGKKLVTLPAGTPLLAKGIPDQLRACQTDTGADVSCAQPHAFKVQAVFLAYAAKRANAPYPDEETFTPTARARCKQLTGTDGGFWQPPSRVSWNAGDHYIRCLVREQLPSTTG